MRTIKLTLRIKAVFPVLAFTGQVTLWMAMFAGMGASPLLVLLQCARADSRLNAPGTSYAREQDEEISKDSTRSETPI